MDPSFIDKASLCAWLQHELLVDIGDDALDAVAHSLHCVAGQHVRAARQGIQTEVLAAVKAGTFNGLPTLRPDHFLPRVGD